MASTLTAGPDLQGMRRNRGISQQRLAELAGCSLSMIRVLESGYLPEVSGVLPRVVAVLSAPETSNDAADHGVVAKTGVRSPEHAT